MQYRTNHLRKTRHVAIQKAEQEYYAKLDAERIERWSKTSEGRERIKFNEALQLEFRNALTSAALEFERQIMELKEK